MSSEWEWMRAIVEKHWRRLYNFVFRITLDRNRAERYSEDIFVRASQQLAPTSQDSPRQVEVQLLRIATHVLEDRLPRQPELNFDILDETLRSEATRTDVVRSLSDPQRDFLLWELKQGCMTAVINCLPPGERAAFVAATILKLNEEEAAAALDINTAAYKVRLSRARKKVGDYLAPRCEHVNPQNPCRCPARVGIAISKGFIPPAGEVSLRKPLPAYGRYGVGPGMEDSPLRDISAVYGSLPDPDPPDELRLRLLARFATTQPVTPEES
jgi:DNA-directed RNA polymerase specialized sigma24 family protein